MVYKLQDFASNSWYLFVHFCTFKLPTNAQKVSSSNYQYQHIIYDILCYN